MNTPYVKEYDANGQLIKPGEVKHEFPNRRQRRERDKRFMNNRKTAGLTVIGNEKYHRVRQMAVSKSGVVHRIEHYITKTKKR